MTQNLPARENVPAQGSPPAQENLPVRQEHGEMVVDTVHDLHPDHRDPQNPHVQQNISVALLPLALISLLVLTFIAAAWTFLAALPPG